MRNYLTLVSLVSLFGSTACMVDGTEAEATRQALTTGNATSAVHITNDWGGGYCANVSIANGEATDITTWTVTLDLADSKVSNLWGGTLDGNTVSPPDGYNATIASGKSVSFGFCAEGTGRATVVGLTYKSAGSPTTCSDGIQNQNETGVDCGGSCAPCGGSGGSCDGLQSWVSNDWRLRFSAGEIIEYEGKRYQATVAIRYPNGACVPTAPAHWCSHWFVYLGECDNSVPTCYDGIQNQGETGVDCGGPCPACSTATCYDGIQNQGETGVDCGGPCPACSTATCYDGIQNQGETGVDCGGPCPACSTATCYDGIQNQGETGVDCGGPCPPCGGKCTIAAPPAAYESTIAFTWKEMTGGFEGLAGARPRSASIEKFTNTILDQLFASDGKLRFCVRWDSSTVASATVRDQIAPALQRNINQWFSQLIGHDCWPYNSDIPVEVTGWAVRDRSQLAWDDGIVPIYVNNIRENAPQCAEACGRFFHREAGYTYPGCDGGFNNHYDMSIWLTDGFGGGVGGDWGQRLSPDTFLGSIAGTNIIEIHEMGHGFGFPDYYNWDVWAPGIAAPNSVMVAGRSAVVTDWDGWMIRHLWSQLKPRWQ